MTTRLAAESVNEAWRHDALADDLASHLSRPERMVWTDMQMGPAGSPRPDVFAMQKSYTNPKPVAYEIKVSLQDLRKDITEGKALGYLKFSSALVFAVPRELSAAALKLLPPRAGLMVRSERAWSTRRKPAIGDRPEWCNRFALKMLIDGVNRERHTHRAKYVSRLNEDLKKRELLGCEIAEALREPDTIKWRAERAAAEHEDYKKRLKDNYEHCKRGILREAGEIAVAMGQEPPKDIWSVRFLAEKLRKLADETSADERVRAAEEAVQVVVRELDRARAVAARHCGEPAK
ncbi:MAG: hypothetical protein AAGA68_24985 [Pseudomonadota bacterium]